MNGLFLHTGNRLEILVAELGCVLSEPLDSPFAPDIVLVQSLGMRRWITLQLAQQLGICMQCEFPFPGQYLANALREHVPDLAPPDAFSPELMTWKIHRLLPELRERPEFAPVRRYIADNDPLKLYQLSSRIAALFDKYLVYRPALLMEWEADPAETFGELFRFNRARQPFSGDEAWQAELWRALNPDRLVHFAAAVERLSAAPEFGSNPAFGFEQSEFEESAEGEGSNSKRVCIFGISSMAPAQMRVFFHLAASRPVHLFLLKPSSEYHGDDLTPKQLAKRGLPISAAGNPLLVSLGRQNTHFLEVLLETDERAGHRLRYPAERFEEPAHGTLLHQLQRDILYARNPALDENGDPAPKSAVSPEDRTLQIHVCHSPMREVEILYDQLLDLFNSPGAPLPREVLVMTPEIEKYAPFIYAVFGHPESSSLRIPFSVADRLPRSESVAIDTFLRLLELPQSRCTAPELYALLQSAPFCAKFGFAERELEQIRQWIYESGVRWGIDPKHRAETGVPGFKENTWRHGLDRLLLGYAMRGGNQTLFEEILPHDEVEGNSAELLGRLVSALEAIFLTIEQLAEARPLGEWPAVFESVVNRFFEDDDEADAVRQLREVFCENGQLATVAKNAGPEQMVAFEAMRAHLAGLLGETEQHGHFLTGGVTFCALKPMRSIPAKAIWLLGMNDGVFPRQIQAVQFDLMARNPALGDRSLRDDDRYLFLETILSARDRLCISYLGRSQHNNESAPPSVVVSELLDAADLSAAFPENQTARQFLVVEHRLQAFSAHYFQPGGKLFSFSRANARASSARLRANRQEAPFFDAPLGEPDAESRNVELDTLVKFFANPAAMFLKRRLGIHLESDDAILPESEPMVMNRLQDYGVKQALLQSRLAGGARPRSQAFTAQALLPPGSLGMQHFEGLDRAVEKFHAKLLPLIGNGKPDEPRAVDLRIGNFALGGVLNSFYCGQLVLFRPSKIKTKDRLRAWIQHLAWCAAHPDAAIKPAILAGEDEEIRFAAPARPAEELLRELLEIYWSGLREPLPFFPESAFAFMTSKKMDIEGRLRDALLKWRGDGFRTPGENEDAACRLCFGESEPLGDEFQRLAEAALGPMIACEKNEA